MAEVAAVRAVPVQPDRAAAESVERSMVDNAKKAGSAAFQFDPDASPEEKAAQVRSVSFL